MSGEQEEQAEQGSAYENPDPENGSEFCVAENEQTEADQATAAAQSKTYQFAVANDHLWAHLFQIFIFF